MGKEFFKPEAYQNTSISGNINMKLWPYFFWVPTKKWEHQQHHWIERIYLTAYSTDTHKNLQEKFTQNWNVTHFLLSTMSIKALVTFLIHITPTGVSQRIPPNGNTIGAPDKIKGRKHSMSPYGSCGVIRPSINTGWIENGWHFNFRWTLKKKKKKKFKKMDKHTAFTKLNLTHAHMPFSALAYLHSTLVLLVLVHPTHPYPWYGQVCRVKFTFNGPIVWWRRSAAGAEDKSLCPKPCLHVGQKPPPPMARA